MKSIVRFHREIQIFAWAKYYGLINFKNNQTKEKCPALLILEEIESLRSNVTGKRKNRPHPDTDTCTLSSILLAVLFYR